MNSTPESELSKGELPRQPSEATPAMDVIAEKEIREGPGSSHMNVPQEGPGTQGPTKESMVVKKKGTLMVGSSPTSREMLNEQAQMLIDEVNAKRKRDTAVLGDFKKSLEIQTSNAYSMVEQNVFQLYEKNGKILQDKLQELFATLDRIAKLELELDQFRVALGTLYKEMN